MELLFEPQHKSSQQIKMIKLARNVGLQGLFGIGNHSMCTTSIHPDVTLDSNQRLANLGSYATYLLTQSLTESPYMNVHFYSYGGDLLHQNMLRIIGF